MHRYKKKKIEFIIVTVFQNRVFVKVCLEKIRKMFSFVRGLIMSMINTDEMKLFGFETRILQNLRIPTFDILMGITKCLESLKRCLC